MDSAVAGHNVAGLQAGKTAAPNRCVGLDT